MIPTKKEEKKDRCVYCGRDTCKDTGFHDCEKSPSGFCIPESLRGYL